MNVIASWFSSTIGGFCGWTGIETGQRDLGVRSMRGTIHSDGPLAPFGLKYRRPSKWSVIVSLAGPEYGCKVAVSQDFISDDRHGRRQREHDQAPRHADAGPRRGHRHSHDGDGPDQPPQLEGLEPSNQVVVQRIH